MKTRQQKEEVVKNLTEKFQRIKSAVFVDFAGLKVKDAQKLRRQSWKQGIDYEVVKKTLLNIAASQAGQEIDVKKLQGNLGIIFGYEDEIAAPRLASDFAKEYEVFKILGGILENKFIDEARVKILASLPSRPEILSQLLRSLTSPISGFAVVLQRNLRGLAQVLCALKEKRSEV